ncbi:MAG: hypothetical protein QGG64_21805, partial [Candidatus Latescibacteria bacterium]|nr:hypothetical protein [Candidatus Latescibacterota bacterium]
TEYLLKRHTALWEAHNKSVRRVMLTGLLFGAFVLFNVLQPYVVRVSALNVEMASFLVEHEQTLATKARLDLVVARLDKVQPIIEQMPWMDEKDALIHRFQEMNRSGKSINRAQYQAEADATVRAIADQVRRDVLQPLAVFYNPPDEQLAKMMPEFVAELSALPQTLDTWVDENIGRRWYVTVQSKSRRVAALTSGLQSQLYRVQQIGQEALPKLREKQFSIVGKLVEMEKRRKTIDADLRKKLDAEIARIVPTWINGVVSISQIFYGYPWAILGMVIYVFWLAQALTQHFLGMAQAEGLSQVDQMNPTLSSVWTLSYRGGVGTAVTLVLYLGFVGLMVWFFERGADVFMQWCGQKQMPISAWITALFWGGRLCFAFMIAGFIYRLYHSRLVLTT